MLKIHSSKEWVKKYFWEGQSLSSSQKEALESLDRNAPWHKTLVVKHRRLVGVLIPFTVVQVIWWCCAVKYDYWSLFPDRFRVSIMMIFGSMITGMTTEGGGAVVFPVMTLAFNITPGVARDFSLMIQSVGMTSATFTIFWMKIQLEWRSLIFCFSGAVFGLITGLEFVDPLLSPAQKKISFVSIWFTFAFALFLLNRNNERKTFKITPKFKPWKALVLAFAGFVGGIFSAVAGNGVNICNFAVLTLLFRVSEKTATPTSVVLMAGTTVLGFFWRQVMMEAIHIDSYRYLAVCAPIVVLGAPLGSVIGSHFHRQVLAALIYVLVTVALVSAFAVVDINFTLIWVSIVIILFGFVFFGFLSYLGHRLMQDILDSDETGQVLQGIGPPIEMTGARVNEAFVVEKVVKEVSGEDRD